MASGSEIGEVSQSQHGEHHLRMECRIKDVLQYTKEDEYFWSPYFSGFDAKWCLQIYPNGESRQNTFGDIGLYLHRTSQRSNLPQNVSFTFGLMNKDGSLVEELNDCHCFKDCEGYGPSYFLRRSQLVSRKDELMPSDVLTIICNLKMVDNHEKYYKLSEDFTSMFISKSYCDATLNVKGKQFPVHRSVLAARSKVFEAMFRSNMKEKDSQTADIPDVDAEAFKDFLLYLYSAKFGNFTGDVHELYRIADKYGVEELMAECVSFIKNNLSPENVCDAIILANLYDESDLNVATQNFFNENFQAIISQPSWISLMKENTNLANQLLENMAEDKNAVDIGKNDGDRDSDH